MARAQTYRSTGTISITYGSRLEEPAATAPEFALGAFPKTQLSDGPGQRTRSRIFLLPWLPRIFESFVFDNFFLRFR
jgi:hypothetical protein